MTHALSNHFGNFLYDSIRRQRPVEQQERTSRARTGKMAEEGYFVIEGAELPNDPPPEWPLFDTPAISSIRLTGFEDKNKTIYFSVLTILHGFQWEVQKTFDDFSSLHKELVPYGIGKSLMPGRKLLGGYFGTPKKESIVEMQEKFEKLLRAVLREFPVPPTPLLKFLEYPFTDILSVTQSLAEFCREEGEVVLSEGKAVQMSPLQLHCVNRRLKIPLESSGTGLLKDDFGHLLDFFHHLKKMKISPPTDAHYTLLASEQLTFDLSFMKSLELLLIDSVEIHLLQGRSGLPGQLTGLEIRRAISTVKDVLVVYPAEMNPLPTSVPQLDKALKWTALKHASFKLNSLKRIDESLRLLPNLVKLDLSYNCIEEIENLMECPQLEVVDLSHNKISSLSDLHIKLGNVVRVGLAHNQIQSLDGIQKAVSLKYIDLGNNDISEVSEVCHLSPLPHLEVLSLQGNPIAHSLSYRSNVFSRLPNVSTVVALDGKKPSRGELQVIASLLTPKGHGKVTTRTANIEPDNDEKEIEEAQKELDETMSITNRLEELRREGGDRWLAIFNAETAKSQEPGNQDDGLIASRSPKERKKRTRRHQRPYPRRRHKSSRSHDRDSSAPPEDDEEDSISLRLQELIGERRQVKIETTTNIQVTILEYPGSFHTLSGSDVDQLLVNSPLEECTVSIDSSLSRALEVVVSASKTRCQRDLALLQDVRLHEGRRLAVCLQFSSFNSDPLWVVYCVPDLESLAWLYVTLQHGVAGSRTHTPDSMPSIGSDTRPTPEETDTHPLQEQEIRSLTPLSGSTQPTTPRDSPSHTPTRSQSPVPSTTTPPRRRSPVPEHLTTPSKLTYQVHSSPATPYSHGSRSPARPCSPVRSKTPEPRMTSAHMLPPPTIISPVKSTTSTLTDSKAPPNQTPVDQPVETNKVVPRKVIKKPGIANPSISSFFHKSLAQESDEILLNVIWGGCCLSSSPSCEIEAGLLVSSKTLYLVEVLDPERHPRRQLSWSTEKLPIDVIFSSSLTTLCKITVGIFDQSVLIDFMEKGVIKGIVFFPRTYEQMFGFTENLKAALDAAETGHQVTTNQDSILNPPESGKVLFLNPDSSDMHKLKEALIRGKILTQVSNFIMTCQSQDLTLLIDEEAKRVSEDACTKFDIVQYVIASEVSMDVLPVGNGKEHLRSRALVLTNNTLYLCKEEIVSWPRAENSSIKPPLPRCCVLDSHPMADIVEVKMCDKAHPVISFSDPVYEFTISFEASEESAAPKGNSQWRLCVHDRQYIDQFIGCLSQLCADIVQNQLLVRRHTAEPLPPAALTGGTDVPVKLKQTKKNPTFIESEILLNFASLTNYQRLRYFKKHVAQAEFMKSDEIPLSVFLAHCSVSAQEYTEIEVCVMVSNYAIYLLSDLDNIRKWIDKGGPSSFLRMMLLNKKDASQSRCFYRLWLNQVAEIRVGLFYLSVQIAECKTGVNVVIHSQSSSATLSFLSALSSNLNLTDSKEEEVLTELLSDYIDLCSDSFSATVQKTKKSIRPSIEFLQPSEAELDHLKKMLLNVSPSVTKTSSKAQSASNLQVLCWQIMLLVEETRVRDTMTVITHPHLVLLTNNGLYICVNAAGEQNYPSVFVPSELTVKKWCHIDLVDHLEITSLPAVHTITVYIRSQQASASSETGMLRLVVQNAELLSYFLHFLALLWHERTGRNLPIHRV